MNYNLQMTKFKLLLSAAISHNQETRKTVWAQDFVAHMSNAEYSREFATIHFNMGRRTGKTSFIIENATPSDLIVVHSESRRRDINSEIRARVQVIRSEELITMQRQVICCEACKRPYENIKLYDTIWVDEPELCFREVNLTRLYNVLAYNPEQTFILLGE